MFVCLTDYYDYDTPTKKGHISLVCSKCKKVFHISSEGYNYLCIYRCAYKNCDGVGLTEEDMRKGIIGYEPVYINRLEDGRLDV